MRGCHTRVARVCSACRARVIFYRRLHTHFKSLIDMQAHARAVFAHVDTRTRNFFTRNNMHTQFINTHALLHTYIALYALPYQPSYIRIYIAIVYT